jgi:peptide/nickel transport system substrate-binding protein
LKKAGLSNHTFTIHASNAAFAGGEDAALLYSEQARKAGINITVKREPKDGYWKNVWMKKPWSMSYYSGKPTADWMFSQAYSIESKWNETFWTNKRFNDLLVDARSELNNDKRRDMYGEMQHIMWNEGGTIIPLFGDFVYAINKKVKFGALAGNYDLDGLRCSERWWFAD